MGLASAIQHKKVSITPEGKVVPSSPERASPFPDNPVTGRFSAKLERWNNALHHQPEGASQVSPETMSRLQRRIQVHQKAANHFETLKSQVSTRDQVPYYMSLVHRDLNDPAGAKEWAEISKLYNQETKGIPRNPMTILDKTFAQSARVNVSGKRKEPPVHGVTASPYGVHDRDAELFHPSPEALGRDPWDLEPIDPMPLARHLDHRSMFESDQRRAGVLISITPRSASAITTRSPRPSPANPKTRKIRPTNSPWRMTWTPCSG